MKNARLFGLILFPLGLFLTYQLIQIASHSDSLLKIFFAGPAVLGAGLGMLILPGKQLSDEEWSVKENRVRTLTEAPNLHRIVWLALGVIALGATMAYTGFV